MSELPVNLAERAAGLPSVQDFPGEKPKLLRPERWEVFLASLRNGASRTASARAAGASHDSLRRLVTRAEGDRPTREHVKAYAELLEAEREGLGKLEQVIVDAATVGDGKNGPDWRAALVLLERRAPAEWSPRAKLDLSAVQPDVDESSAQILADPEVARALSEAAKRRNAGE